MNDMKEKVYEFLRNIPAGKVVTYGQIAGYLGNKGLARAVGNILHCNPDGDRNPCYKVVDRNGRLSRNYAFGGIEKQAERLENDGISVIDHRVDLSRYQLRNEDIPDIFCHEI